MPRRRSVAHAAPLRVRACKRPPSFVAFRRPVSIHEEQPFTEPCPDEQHRDRVAERLEGRILKATDLWPWTPAEIYYWTFAWLHALAYGEEAKTRKRWQRFYGPMPDEKRGLFPDWNGVASVLQFDDIDMIVELLEDDKRRHRAIP